MLKPSRTDLVGEHIILRPNSIAFTSQRHAAAMESLATVGKWMPWCYASRTETEGFDWYRTCEANWDSSLEHEFSIFDLKRTFAGAAGVNQLNPVHGFAKTRILDTRVAPGLWTCGRGCIHSREFGFGALGLRLIEIVTAVDNLPSRRVAEKVGARFEGIAAHRILMRRVSVDAAMYALLPEVSELAIR
ncbi:MAG: GNAT family protein [Casimicrobiaceae bacterium]